MSLDEARVAAMLKLIRFAEHQNERDDVYFLLYGGRQRFADTRRHPNRAITAWGHTSTAAGAYQILYPTWKEAFDKGQVNDFTKASQDKLARLKLQSRGALKLVQDGEIERAITLLRSEWTSLPGAKQSKMRMTEARALFDRYVTEFSTP